MFTKIDSCSRILLLLAFLLVGAEKQMRKKKKQKKKSNKDWLRQALLDLIIGIILLILDKLLE